MTRDELITLLLYKEEWNKAALVFKHEALEGLIEKGFLDFEDREDGRYYKLTTAGRDLQKTIEDDLI